MYNIVRLLNDLDAFGWDEDHQSRYFSPVFQQRENKMMLAVDLPGVKKENLEVHLEKNTLQIKAARKDGFRDATYKRTVQIPSEVNPETLDAILADGVLTLSFALRDKALLSKKIDIR